MRVALFVVLCIGRCCFHGAKRERENDRERENLHKLLVQDHPQSEVAADLNFLPLNRYTIKCNCCIPNMFVCSNRRFLHSNMYYAALNCSKYSKVEVVKLLTPIMFLGFLVCTHIWRTCTMNSYVFRRALDEFVPKHATFDAYCGDE